MIIHVLILVLVASLLSSTMELSFAETIPTVITLDSIPKRVELGSTLTFSGTLMSQDQNYVITGAKIHIKDDDFGPDDLIATAITDQNGRFDVSVIVKDWDQYSMSTEIYAVYEGNSMAEKSRSQTQSVQIVYSNNGYSQRNDESYVALTMSTSTGAVHVGDVVTFYGRLGYDGAGLPGKLIQIKEDDPLSPDETLAYGTTDSNGYYSIRWIASPGLVERDFDVYAVFQGDQNFSKVRTNNHNLHVSKYSGSITLDPIPSSARIGDNVVLSGRLVLESQSPTNAIIYIKDEDALNPDDLLVTAYADSQGYFSANWIVRNVDRDFQADIYAVFEGNHKQYRLTTCDANPTFDFGGICNQTQKLDIFESTPKASGSPQNYKDVEYMKLLYSLDFTENPKVAIVPSPDSYADVKSHIIPVQEGIIMWEDMLEQRYGGDWEVDFEIITPGTMFADTRPDVVINIVTGDEDAGCVDEYLGWAKTNKSIMPIQVHVCSDDGSTKRNNAGISTTSAHEFAHAVGVGHAFNKRADMMCSFEYDYGYTCPSTTTKSPTPSELNLEAVVSLYGRDGFKIPNPRYYPTLFTLDNYVTNTHDRDYEGQYNPNHTKSPKSDQPHAQDLKYRIHGGYVNTIFAVPTTASIVLDINPFSDGKIIITIPRDVLDAKKYGHNNIDDVFFVLIDGKESDFKEYKNSGSRFLLIPFTENSKEIEIIGTIFGKK